VGARIRLPDASDSAWRTIVGVVKDIRFRSLRDPTPMLFLRWRQMFWQGTLAVRTTGTLGSVLPALRRVLSELEPRAIIWEAKTMREYMAGPLAEPRLNALLLSAFGAVALFLAAVGLYGVMASSVRQQTQEISVRMAIGATPARVRGEVIRTAIATTAMGIGAGAFVVLTGSKVLSSLLFETSPADPISLVGAVVLLLVIGLSAALLPAHRATAIDPAQALRAE